ncbi:MAG: AAA family ATPase [Chloroflexi bacterium]|nr:AAA family ATPase [Chloroflexota bacterium]
MNCPSCGTENEAGRKFCTECGTRLAAACPSCGTVNPPDGKFCGECGTALGASARSTAPPTGDEAGSAKDAPVAERRLVSVLFADLVGFTTISESRDAEDVRELLDGYFGTCREIIGRYGGTIEKFIGDAVMAVWGTPIAQEDDAERAVRAALDLVEAVRRIGEGAEVPGLALRAGVLTGEAAVTIGASNMGMVAGDLVNSASRLQSVAAPGTVLVGDSTRRGSAEAIAYESAGDHVVKGKELPISAWRAVRVVAQRGGVGRSEQLEAPFVGRSAELQLIKDFYHGTARDRGVRLVSVIGQAGIGKSRLAWEFLKYIDGVTEDVYWHQGRSPSYGEGITFWALGEMVRMRLGIGDGTDDATTRTSLTAILEEFVPDADERRTLEGPLLQLLGIEDRPGTERGQLFTAWRTFFERIAEHGPVVLVFEDLQWADEGMIDFIEDLLAWSRGHPIYVITLARPELLDRRPTWGAGHRAFTSIGIEPLTAEEMTELLAGLVPGLPDAAVRTIIERAEGIPLYAVETVRMLLNDGRLRQSDGAYEPVGDLSELAVPETLHALIAARLDGLDSSERSLLQDAAVLGISFGADALAALSGDPVAEIEPKLRHLAQRELIVLDDDPRSPERGQYRFVQGLIREVAYGTLARRDRRARHLAAARHFESLGDDELAGVLAEHYLEAHRAQPDGEEGAAVAAQARVALRAAASRSRGLGSHVRAFGYLEQAIEISVQPEDELALHVEAALAAADGGKLEPSVSHAERAIEIATAIGDHGTRRRATALLANVLTEGHQERGNQLVGDALAEPGLTPEDEGYVDLAEAQAKLAMRMSRYVEAVEVADRALPHADGAGMRQLTVELLITRGVSLANVNRQIEAVATLTGAMALAERFNLPESELRAAINLGYALEPEDPAAAQRISREGMEKARRWGHRWGLRYLLGNACDGAILIGDWDWALTQLATESEEELEPPERLWLGSTEAVILALRGEDVDQRVEEIKALAAPYDDEQYRGLAIGTEWAAMLSAGRYAELVDKLADISFSSVGSVDNAPPIMTQAALRLGDASLARRMVEVFEGARRGRRATALRTWMKATLAALEGRRDEARAGYLESMQLMRELELWWPLGLVALDAVIAGVLDPGETQRVADEARSTFTRLGARPYLDQLDEALTSARSQPRAALTGDPTAVPAAGDQASHPTR